MCDFRAFAGTTPTAFRAEAAGDGPAPRGLMRYVTGGRRRTAGDGGRRRENAALVCLPCTVRMLAGMSESSTLDPEDRKIVTLARSTRARNAVPEGAAVRDETGRTYVAGTVALESLRLTALQTAVAMAVASGATSLEAAAVVTEAEAPADADLAAVRDLGGADTPILLAGPDGEVRGTTRV